MSRRPQTAVIADLKSRDSSLNVCQQVYAAHPAPGGSPGGNVFTPLTMFLRKNIPPEQKDETSRGRVADI